MANPTALVQKLWNYCNILRDDGLSYGKAQVERRLSVAEELKASPNFQRATRLRQSMSPTFSRRLVSSASYG
jgi:hypothetical protein